MMIGSVTPKFIPALATSAPPPGIGATDRYQGGGL